MQAIKDILDLMGANLQSILSSISNPVVQDRLLNPRVVGDFLMLIIYGVLSILLRKWLGNYLTFYKGWFALIFGILLIFLGILGFFFLLTLPPEGMK